MNACVVCVCACVLCMNVYICSGPEMQILDYVTHQYKLLPEIAKSYALKMASRFMMEMYVASKGQILEGDLSSLPVVSICLMVSHVGEITLNYEIF